MLNLLIVALVLILVILIIILFAFLYIRGKVKKVSLEYFQTDNLKEAINQSRVLDSETPKSISSMESIKLPYINKDFPDLNINELKRMGEQALIECFKAISNKDSSSLKYSPKIKAWVDSKINDVASKDVKYSDFKIHKTVISDYQKKGGIATIYFQCGVEYYYNDGSDSRKIQDRYRLEYIYIIDESKVDVEKKNLGLNCPNCGAPIKNLGEKSCVYCGSGIKEIVKRVWTLNNIDNY